MVGASCCMDGKIKIAQPKVLRYLSSPASISFVDKHDSVLHQIVPSLLTRAMARSFGCKSICRAILNWSTLFKSTFVAIVIGTALTLVNYGDVFMESKNLPCWWKVMLNFTVPFIAEILLCVLLPCFLNADTDELVIQSAKQAKYLSEALPEIAIHTKPLEKSKNVKIQLQEFEKVYEPRHSRRHESCPVFAFPLSPFADFDPASLRKNEGCVRTHRNGVSIYTVNELLDAEGRGSEDLVATIQPLPKEGVKFQYNKCKSMSCLSDLEVGRGGLATSRSRETRKLQVFDNDLFFPE